MLQSLNLFKPLDLRSVTSRNRIVIPPMCQYSAYEGHLDDWHLVHLGRFATGGAGIVFTEATAVQKSGRITHGCPGLWADSQIVGHAQIAQFARRHGAIPAIQLAHAGRKSGMQRPWFGNGPLDQADFARGDMPWPAVGPSAVAIKAGWPLPNVLSEADIDTLIVDFAGPQNGRRRRNIRSPRCMAHMAICCIVFSRHYPIIGPTAMVGALPDGCG